MSYDVHVGRTGDWNYTTNMAPAWRAAGADLAEFHGKRASTCARVLAAALEKMRATPADFERFNASNGWGSMATLVPALERLLAQMRERPRSIVRVSR